jgi:hypothetical protein
MSTSNTRRFLRLLPAVSLAAGVLAVPAVLAGSASAATTTSTLTWTDPTQSFRYVIPAGVTMITVTATGAAGQSGSPSGGRQSAGGLGGSGMIVSASYYLPLSGVNVGDTLQIGVGGAGYGGAGGNGASPSGPGGGGGSATWLRDGSTGTYLAVAAGGGGGGGGGGAATGRNGGNGGPGGLGGTPSYNNGVLAGRGGAAGSDPNCPGGVAVDPGQAGESAASGSNAGGGGGGGGGYYCGGQSGGSGDHGAKSAGGGGGGSGNSFFPASALGPEIGTGANTGNGTLTITFVSSS